MDNARNHTLLQTQAGRTRPSERAVQIHQSRSAANRPALIVETASREVRQEIDRKSRATVRPQRVRRATQLRRRKRWLRSFNKDDFKNDPLIQKALEIFKGQIVEVRA